MNQQQENKKKDWISFQIILEKYQMKTNGAIANRELMEKSLLTIYIFVRR